MTEQTTNEERPVKSWSASKFECYKQCPWKFWALYIAKKSTDLVSMFINFGNTVHAVLDEAGKMDALPGRDWIIDRAKKLWLPDEETEIKFQQYKEEKGMERWQFLGYKSRNEEIQYQKLALQMLFDYLLNREFVRPFKTEQYLVFDWRGDYKLTAKVDRTEVYRPDGTPFVTTDHTRVGDLKADPEFMSMLLKVLDFKTGKKRLNTYQLRNDIATTIYVWSTLRELDLTEQDLPRIQTGQHYLRRHEGQEPGEVIAVLSADDMKKNFAKMEETVYQVERGIFPKKESRLCSYCELEKECKGK